MTWMITRIVIKAIFIVALLLALANYAFYLKTGRFWVPDWNAQSVTMPNLTMPDFSNIFNGQQASMEPVTKPTEPTYKWRKNGRWHYGDVPPKGVKAELISD